MLRQFFVVSHLTLAWIFFRMIGKANQIEKAIDPGFDIAFVHAAFRKPCDIFEARKVRNSAYD